MSWLTQKEGIIDHFRPNTFLGTQPVRVIHPMLLYMFKNSHDEFADELNEVIQSGKLNSEFDFQFGEHSIMRDDGKFWTPRIIVETKQIQLHESFLAYQWCITYSIYILFLETIDYAKVNKELGYDNYKITPANIEEAREVCAYAKSLVVHFSEWDKKELPNPEIYLAENRNYVEQTNCIYTESIKFILCHEYIHAKEHLDKEIESDSHYIEIEKEADAKAMDLMLEGKNPINKWALNIGIVIGIISMFFFRATTQGKKHPNAEDRLTWALEKIDEGSDYYYWAFAIIGFEIWDEQFEIGFDWSSKGKCSYKELYYDIVNQIKQKGA